MWQVDFLIAVERERERQRELDRRRALVDAALGSAADVDASGTRARRLVRLAAFMGRLAAAVVAVGSALDRPGIGPHHV